MAGYGGPPGPGQPGYGRMASGQQVSAAFSTSGPLSRAVSGQQGSSPGGYGVSPMGVGPMGAGVGPPGGFGQPAGASPVGGAGGLSRPQVQFQLPPKGLAIGDSPAQFGVRGVPLDTTGDNVPDAMGFDTTGDGVVDCFDTTGDGRIDKLVQNAPAKKKGIVEDGDEDDDGGYAFKRILTGFTSSEQAAYEDELKAVYKHIDRDRSGSISLLEFMGAVQRDEAIADLVAPGIERDKIMSDEDVFDACSAAFEGISGGKNRIDYESFQGHFIGAVKNDEANTARADLQREVFAMVDKNQSGDISKLQLLDGVRNHPQVAAYFLPGVDDTQVLDDQNTFDAVTAVFDAVAGGKKRFDFTDFTSYFKVTHNEKTAKNLVQNRPDKKVLIVGIGFGLKINPMQSELVLKAGYQIKWVHGLPNPEQPGFPVDDYTCQLKEAIDEFKPDVVCAASKGSAYLTALWAAKMWKGPSLMINAHPSAKILPKGVPLIIAHGSNDEVYTWDRAYLEKLIRTGTDNKCLLYYTANSGPLPSGQCTRMGDMHNQDSLCGHDCLPTLIDCALSGESPEIALLRSWRGRLGTDRIAAECFLGYTHDQLNRYWTSVGRRGRDDKKTCDVSPDSKEYDAVMKMFRSPPKEKAAYCGENHAAWLQRRVLKIERVENGTQADGSAKPYMELLRKSLVSQGLTFEPGVHTCWAFHGTDAIDSIVNNPVAGFQPLASGTKGASLWGSGTYFARDPKYVAEGGFAKASPAGEYRMLMCLLAMGIPCVGDPNHHGVLPERIAPHRYNSSVDFLSCPEIFVMQHPGAAYPAYVITFL